MLVAIVILCFVSHSVAAGGARLRSSPSELVQEEHVLRDLIQVGKRNPKEDDRRGNNEDVCSRQNGGFNKNPCLKGNDSFDILCLYYPGFQEYYCECESANCPDPAVDTDYPFCVNGYTETQISLNGGRTFWNCKDNNAFFPPP